MSKIPRQHQFAQARSTQDRRRAAVSKTPERRQGERRREDLSWVPLFAGLDAQRLDRALSHCELIELQPGVVLLEQGQPNLNVYVSLSGELEARLDAEENPNAFILIPPGEGIGELSAIDGMPASARVVTRTAARVLKIDGSVFWDELMTIPKLAANFTRMLSGRVRRVNEMALKAQRKELELEHLRRELDLARQLQASMLPLQNPLFPERQDIEASGFMEAAASVGGDFFDAFFVDRGHLFFCIGDVSGHGVASALFMARTIGLVRSLALTHGDPADLLAALNTRLCEGNDTNIFVTLWCGVLNVASGELRYCSAGHCPPFLVRSGQCMQLPGTGSPLAGVIAEARFRSATFELAAGMSLVCYTDGLTEARNASDEEYGEDRCKARLASAASHQPLAAVLEDLRADMRGFSQRPELEDDCTLLAVRRPT